MTKFQTVKTVANHAAKKAGLVAKHFVLAHAPQMPRIKVHGVWRPDVGQYGVIIDTKSSTTVPFFKDGQFTPA